MRFLSPLLAVFLAACAMNDATNKHLAPPKTEVADNHPPPPGMPRTTSELAALAEMRAAECEMSWRTYQQRVEEGKNPLEVIEGVAARVDRAGEAVLAFLEEHPGHEQLVRGWAPEEKDWASAPGYVQLAFYNCFKAQPRSVATPGGSCKVAPGCGSTNTTQH